MKFDDETGEFDGELTDKDVYDLFVKAGMFSEDDLSFKEFLVLRDFLNAGYSDEEALLLAKGFGEAQKYGQK